MVPVRATPRLQGEGPARRLVIREMVLPRRQDRDRDQRGRLCLLCLLYRQCRHYQ
jgi:hypothetical protein